MIPLMTPPAIVRPDEPPTLSPLAADYLAMFPRAHSYNEAAGSEANRELVAIGKALEALNDRMAAWSAKHTDCNCVFCYATDNGDGHFNEDMAGAMWPMRVVASFIDTSTLPIPKKKR